MIEGFSYMCENSNRKKEEFIFDPSDFENKDSFVDCSLRKKEYECSVFSMLPFSHTVEAEALGAKVILKGKKDTPKVKDPVCKTLEEILLLPPIDYQNGRIKEIILACRILKEKGECVLYELSGPFTILSSLIDLTIVFRAVRKDREKLLLVYKKLEEELLIFSRILIEEGAGAISYADPAVAAEIIGEKTAIEVMEQYTYPFLKTLSKEVNKRALLILCPKLSSLLFKMGKAKYEEILCEEKMTYGEACKKMIGRAEFAGMMCIHNEQVRLQNQTMKIMSLI